MLVANVVPPRWKKALDFHGIEYRELTNRDYIEFLKKKDPSLLEKFRKRLSQPSGPRERELPRSKESTRITTAEHKHGILWSRNIQKYPGWLLTVAKAIELQGFVWWDVSWRVKVGLFTPHACGVDHCFVSTLDFVCHAHRPCHDKVIDSFTETIDKEMDTFESLDDPKYDKLLQEWETIVMSILRVVRLRREGVSLRKIAAKLDTTTYFVREVLKYMKQL